MLKIRLQRFGRKHEPVFRLVLTDSKNSTKSGKFLESLGSYDARRGEESSIKTERVSYWMSQGAKLSDTVHNLLVSKKIIEGKKINTLPKKKAIVKETPAEMVAQAPVEAPSAPAEEVSAPEETKEPEASPTV